MSEDCGDAMVVGGVVESGMVGSGWWGEEPAGKASPS
jgi:hypothetical protein